MSYAIRWIANRQFLFLDFLFVVAFSLSLYFGWPYLPEFGRYMAIATVCAMTALLIIGIVYICGQGLSTLFFAHKKRGIDMRVYEHDQLSLPYPDDPEIEINEEDDEDAEISAPVPQNLLQAANRNLQRLQP